MLPASGKVFYDVGVVCCLSVVELGVLFGEDLRGGRYFLTRITAVVEQNGTSEDSTKKR